MLALVAFAAGETAAQERPVSRSIPAACVPLKGSGGFVDCYLRHYPAVANAIVFWFSAEEAPKPWPLWTDKSRQAVRDAYKHSVDWYAGGMNNYAGLLTQDPPESLNDAQLIAGQPAYLVHSAKDVWILYTGHVGLALAAETEGWVPWSILSYSQTSLNHLFNAYGAQGPNGANSTQMFWPTQALPGYAGAAGYINFSGMPPANATTVFKFMKENNLIGTTPRKTIGKVLGWSSQLRHSFCGWGDPQILFAYWQYYFGPTVSRVLEGTVYNGPGQCGMLNAGVQHYTTGCGGTVSLWKWVLRSVNVPAANIGILVEPGVAHGGAWFPSENAYISHGDQPYDSFAAGYNPEDLLLAPQTFAAWFPVGDFAAAQKNVDRRVTMLAINFPGPSLVYYYCQDVQNGKDHASGQVYERFKPFLSVANLEAMGLWDKLAAMAPGCVANP
ncbi:MAG: hypothetical protein JNN08_16825 [Bryobacterales bacterium]|nr:hypothetical protein [Bryobacterales bacterium]